MRAPTLILKSLITLKIEAPLASVAEAMAAARRDPIGLLTAQQAKAENPAMSALKVRIGQK
jgi:hypothetical protein